MLEITVNGIPYTLEELPGEKLSDLLRERLHLTGTKVGCGEGRCSICTVLVDGVPTRSCITRFTVGGLSLTPLRMTVWLPSGIPASASISHARTVAGVSSRGCEKWMLR